MLNNQNNNLLTYILVNICYIQIKNNIKYKKINTQLMKLFNPKSLNS